MLNYSPTGHMNANLLTKPLVLDLFKTHVKKIFSLRLVQNIYKKTLALDLLKTHFMGLKR